MRGLVLSLFPTYESSQPKRLTASIDTPPVCLLESRNLLALNGLFLGTMEADFPKILGSQNLPVSDGLLLRRQRGSGSTQQIFCDSLKKGRL